MHRWAHGRTTGGTGPQIQSTAPLAAAAQAVYPPSFQAHPAPTPTPHHLPYLLNEAVHVALPHQRHGAAAPAGAREARTDRTRRLVDLRGVREGRRWRDGQSWGAGLQPHMPIFGGAAGRRTP